MLIRVVCLGLITVTMVPSAVTGQQRTVVRGEAVGTLTARRVLSIGSANEINAVIGRGTTSRDSKGRYFHASIQANYRIRIYDGSGILADSLGSRGGGPGEFEWIHGLQHVPGDTLYVFDNDNARMTRFAPDGSIAGTGNLALLSWNGLPLYLGDGRFMFPARVATAERVGYPIHIVNLRGEIEASFGAQQPVYRRDQPYLDRRVIAAAPDGGVWSAHVARYRVELWDAQRQLRRIIDREVDWFEPWEDKTLRVPRDQPPRSYIRAIWQDPSSRLWIAIAAAGDHWAEAVSEEFVAPNGTRTYRITDDAKYRKTIIEVLDVSSGALLASTQLSADFVQFFPNGQILAYREDAIGNPYLDVWELTLSRPPTRR